MSTPHTNHGGRHQLGLDSYDRFFPNQDTMPKGAFGNLIALPLQFAPRKAGNSGFIDSDFSPYPDQWQFLSTIRRMPVEAAEEVVAEAQSKGDPVGVRRSIADDEGVQDPWTLPPSRKREEKPIEGPLPQISNILEKYGIAVLPAQEWRKAVPWLRAGQDTIPGLEGRAIRVLDAFFFEEL
jgi:hypothetical protein